MQHTDKATAEFEAWWIRQPHRERFEDLKQQFCNVAVAFYQKGREGVVIELPEEVTNVTNKDFEAGRDAVVAAIEAAGVTVRG